MNIEEAARALGAAPGEIVSVDDSPAGPVVQHADGNRYIDVSTDTPDADGKTGWMYLWPPELPNGRTYVGDFPVYAPLPDDLAGADAAVEQVTEVVTGAGSQQEVLDKAALLERAKELGVEGVNGRSSAATIAEAIANHEGSGAI